MAIVTEDEVRRIARQKVRVFSESTERHLHKALNSQQQQGSFDVFLSHAYRDAELIVGVKLLIESYRKSVYIDWIEDQDLDRSEVTPATARVLRERMRKCKTLVFVTTDNSPSSKWMPWELGYFDALRNRVSVFPLENTPGVTRYHGQEYLGLYPYITQEPSSRSQQSLLWVNRTPSVYVEFTQWIDGENPYKHDQ